MMQFLHQWTVIRQWLFYELVFSDYMYFIHVWQHTIIFAVSLVSCWQVKPAFFSAPVTTLLQSWCIVPVTALSSINQDLASCQLFWCPTLIHNIQDYFYGNADFCIKREKKTFFDHKLVWWKQVKNPIVWWSCALTIWFTLSWTQHIEPLPSLVNPVSSGR